MSVIFVYLLLIELAGSGLILLFFNELVQAFPEITYLNKILWSILAFAFSHSIRIAFRLITANIKTEYKELKKMFETFLPTIEKHDMEIKGVQNCLEGLKVNMDEISTNVSRINVKVDEIDAKLERKRLIEIAKKEFKQELDNLWKDYSHQLDERIKNFSEITFKKLSEFVIEIHKYDMNDIDYDNFIMNHSGVMNEIEVITCKYSIPSDFTTEFFKFIKSVDYKYYKVCKRNFESGLNSKRKKFENDSIRYILNVLDCTQLLWTDYTLKSDSKCIRNEVLNTLAEDI